MELQGNLKQNGASARSITAVLIDDEIAAINTLRGMLQEYCPQVQILGTALSVKEGVAVLNASLPDVVFLDIQMPPLGSGFDILEQCAAINFGVIFITAFPEYALNAIKLAQPWAYLVKPYSVSELRQAVQVAEEKLRNIAANELQRAQRQIIVIQDSRKGALVLRAGEIMYCRADRSATDIFVWRNRKVEKITSSRNLGEYEFELPTALFCRTHHSYLVNLDYVERFERTGRNGIIHFPAADHKADVSVSKMDVFVERLEAFCQSKTL